jgi:hypothetical protein
MAYRQTAFARNLVAVTDKLVDWFMAEDVSGYIVAALCHRRQECNEIPSAVWSWSNIILMLAAGATTPGGTASGKRPGVRSGPAQERCTSWHHARAGLWLRLRATPNPSRVS